MITGFPCDITIHDNVVYYFLTYDIVLIINKIRLYLIYTLNHSQNIQHIIKPFPY